MAVRHLVAPQIKFKIKITCALSPKAPRIILGALPFYFLLTVTIHGCEDDIVESPLGNGSGGVDGLVLVHGRRRVARLDGAEAARACARVPHQLRTAGWCAAGDGGGEGRRRERVRGAGRAVVVVVTRQSRQSNCDTKTTAGFQHNAVYLRSSA